MAATIIDGKSLAAATRASLKSRLDALAAHGVRPGLAAVLVGTDPASRVYVRNKVRACEETGVHSEVHEFPDDVSENSLLERVTQLNADPRVHGILVQLPLPRRLAQARVLAAVSPAKDVDGFHALNLGALLQGRPGFVPGTPAGVMRLLEHAGVPLAGGRAVIVGRSTIVGKPLALMLIARGATVSVCSSKTPDLRQYTGMADILAVAVGNPGLVDGSMIKPGAVVIDVGINRLPGGKLVGDVDFASASRVASKITPVPGGVGRMTVAMLLENTVTAAERSVGLG